MSLRGKRVIIRADAGPLIGGGHVFRTTTLGKRLTALGAKVFYATTGETLRHLPQLAAGGFSTVELDGPVETEGKLLGEKVGAVDLTIVDHYQRGLDFERACRSFSGHIMVIDDVPNRPHDCDLLLDQSLDRTPEDYQAWLPAGATCMLGPRYALLRPQFVEQRSNLRRSGELRRVLIMVGAADPRGVSNWVLETLQEAGMELEVDLVAGPLSAVPDTSGARVKVHSAVENMAGLMARADLAIGAAGSASWERCCLGLPSLLFVLADNQREVCAALERHRAAINLGDFEKTTRPGLVNALRGLDKTCLKEMGRRASELCDGEGCDRVAATLVELLGDGEK